MAPKSRKKKANGKYILLRISFFSLSLILFSYLILIIIFFSFLKIVTGFLNSFKFLKIKFNQKLQRLCLKTIQDLQIQAKIVRQDYLFAFFWYGREMEIIRLLFTGKENIIVIGYYRFGNLGLLEITKMLSRYKYTKGILKLHT